MSTIAGRIELAREGMLRAVAQLQAAKKAARDLGHELPMVDDWESRARDLYTEMVSMSDLATRPPTKGDAA